MTAEADDDLGRRAERGLIEGVLRREEKAFRAMYRSHTPRLYRYALALTGGHEADAEDLIQETWRRSVPALRGFEGRSSLSTWLSAILVRCASERRRATRHESGTPIDDEVPHRSAARNGTEPVGAGIDLERAFAALPEGFRTVLLLHDLEGFRHIDIAELLGISEGTSKSQLSRARARMRDLLGDDYVRS